jgi:hypothetical protein
MLFLIVPLAFAGLQSAYADQTLTRTQSIQLNAGDTLVIQSDRSTIQQVFVEGNLTDTTLTKPSGYPVDHFEVQALKAGNYELRIIFDYPHEYTVNTFAKTQDLGISQNNATYYMSGGSFELDVSATFNARSNTSAIVTPSLSPWGSFLEWVGKFGQAFPLWVKLVYFTLGFQFFVVGGLWIRREAKRKESTAQRLDFGNKAYLWLDVGYKFLVVSFVSIVAIMGGELVILFILRFMFLASFDLLSLWDLFVVGFAAGAIVMVYLMRFTLEKAFDLKPVEDE